MVRGELITIGDVIKVKLVPDEEGLATVVDIKMRGCESPMIKVRWFYTPQEVGIKHDCFGVAEVFDSTKHAVISLETYIEKAYVLTIDDYNCLDDADDCTYYCRATYVNAGLIPPIHEWKSMCVCHQIINPDQHMIQCEDCLEFFHLSCTDTRFICPNCLS